MSSNQYEQIVSKALTKASNVSSKQLEDTKEYMETHYFKSSQVTS
jgi:hypothetical protein